MSTEPKFPARPANIFIWSDPTRPGINILQNLYYDIKILQHIKIKFENSVTSLRFNKY